MSSLARPTLSAPRDQSVGRRMKRVIHVTTVPASLQFFRGQTRLMRQHGFELSFVSSPGPELIAFGREEDAEVFGVEMLRKITPLRDLKSLGEIVQHFRAKRPHIVHAHTPKGGLLGTLAARAAGVQTRIYHIRGLPLMGASGLPRALLTTTEWVTCRSATHVLAVGPSLRLEAIRGGICAFDRIRVLGTGSGQGVDVTYFDPARIGADTRRRVREELGIPSGAPVVGFVGRLVGDKGVRELATCWLELRERNPDLRLVLVGSFEPRDPVPRAIRSILESDRRVHLTGFRRDLPELYAAMDVVTLPSYREGFPNVPLEAAAMNLPLVGTNIVGMVDAVEDGVSGVLVPPKDPAALRDAIQSYVHDARLRRRHGDAGRARVVRSFARPQVIQHLLDFYQLIMEQNPEA